MQKIIIPSKSDLRRNGITPIGEIKEGKPGGIPTYAMFCRVELASIFNAAYQRGVSSSHVMKMRKLFNIRAVDPLTLSYRPTTNGNVWNVDGSHRKDMLGELGYGSWYAVVHFGLGYEEEASLFFTKNDAPRRMNGWVKFKAGYNAGNDVFRKLVAMAEKNKLTTPMSPGIQRVKDADVVNQAALLFPFNKGGYPLVNLVLKVMDKCWRENNGGPVQEASKETNMLRGLTAFLAEHSFGPHPLPWNTIYTVLKNIPASQIVETARKQIAKGRIDMKQYRDAFCEVFGKNKYSFDPPHGKQRIAA